MVSLPAFAPVTMPELFTEALVFMLFHAPLLPVCTRAMVAPAHTLSIPVMVPATGEGLTVIILVLKSEPQILVKV